MGTRNKYELSYIIHNDDSLTFHTYCTFTSRNIPHLPENLEGNHLICSPQSKAFDEGIYRVRNNKITNNMIGDWLSNISAQNVKYTTTINLPYTPTQFKCISGEFYVLIPKNS